jgi:HAD superfamily phosphatase (TIGR01668 family)
MLNKFKPTWMVESIYHITPEQLEKNNIKGVLTDLDNTLIAWNNPEGTQELKDWIALMKENAVPVVIISNNSDKRIKIIADKLQLSYVPRSMKPSRRGYVKAAEQLQIPLDQCLMVGDQLLTDVFGANRAGVKSVWVMPIINSDGWNTRINRFFERKLLKRLLKNDPGMIWRKSLD